MSSATSRAGLVPTPKKNLKYSNKCKKTNNGLPAKFEAIPAPLSLRPFGGLYNPYAKGCSVLCNHPAPTEVKDIINQLKASLTIEGKNIAHVRENLDSTQLFEADNIPEDLFRRYTDTDSRPLTPTPTVTSVHTRTSIVSFLNNRRCITPELGKNENIKRKKIILDLRKSHSQETLYWKPSSDVSQSAADSSIKPKSAGANEEKATIRNKQKLEEQRLKTSSLATATLQKENVDEVKKVPQACINDRDLIDENVRRGRKRKKIKPSTGTTTFHLSEDPETQVAALGPDSLNPSTRPSLIPNSTSLLPSKDKRDGETILLKGSFLTDEAFQALKIDLDIDVIENTFGKYLNRAMREAIKYIPPKPVPINRTSKEFDKFSNVTQSKMPRKFSKSATRFDVPLNLQILEKISVLDYLSKYVWVSRQRKQLYKRIFLKYLIKEEDLSENNKMHSFNNDNNNNNNNNGDNNNKDGEHIYPHTEYLERKMYMENLPQALEDVLEFHATEDNISKLLNLLEYEKITLKELDFRTWCGIVSFAERLALDDSTYTDSCDELEKADFDSMEQRLEQFNLSRNLQEVLNIIRSTHCPPQKTK